MCAHCNFDRDLSEVLKLRLPIVNLPGFDHFENDCDNFCESDTVYASFSKHFLLLCFPFGLPNAVVYSLLYLKISGNYPAAGIITPLVPRAKIISNAIVPEKL
jgi:hypothetical protein